jgi:transcriptional regulator with XRE-family HTH domain
MAQPTDPAAERRMLGRALAYLRKEAGLNQAQAGEKIGTSGQNWAKYETGGAPTIQNAEVQRRLAQAVNSDVETWMMVRARLAGARPVQADRLFSEPGAGLTQLLAPQLVIRHRLQAAWTLDDEEMNFGSWHIGRDPRFEGAAQWLGEILDDHADQLGLTRGDLVHCVSAEDVGFYPRTGDLVIVERSRPVEEREITLRQVENTAHATLLHARTSNLRHRQLELPATVHEVGEGPRILAFVTASIRRY